MMDGLTPCSIALPVGFRATPIEGLRNPWQSQFSQILPSDRRAREARRLVSLMDYGEWGIASDSDLIFL